MSASSSSPSTVLEQKDGFWHRPGTSDLVAIADTRRMFRREGVPGPGDVVLDLGAHIGTFTRRALDAGAVHVRAVEPDTSNVELFKKNLEDDSRVTLCWGAVADTEFGVIDLYLNNQKGTDSHTVQPLRGREAVAVPAYTLRELCVGYDPTFVKIDIEGGEFYCDLITDFPASADRLFIELHFFRKKDHRAKAEMIRESIIHDLGFTPVWESRWTEKAWWAEGMFRR